MQLPVVARGSLNKNNNSTNIAITKIKHTIVITDIAMKYPKQIDCLFVKMRTIFTRKKQLYIRVIL